MVIYFPFLSSLLHFLIDKYCHSNYNFKLILITKYNLKLRNYFMIDPGCCCSVISTNSLHAFHAR